MKGISIWKTGRKGLAKPLSPTTLASLGQGWKDGVERFAPWREGAEFYHAQAASEDVLPILVCGECGSSLDAAWALAAEDRLPVWGSVLAVSQTGGRGQLRRRWESPPGNIYAAWRLPKSEGNLDSLAPLVAGLALVECLGALGVSCLLKWPNDILADGRKVAGVLLEERGGSVLAGIGINVEHAPPPDKLRSGRAAPAGTLAQIGHAGAPLPLWAKLVECGRICYQSCVSAPYPGALLERIERRLAWMGRTVLVREGETTVYRARVAGLAEDGGLRLTRAKDGSFASDTGFTLHSGSISLP